jgi:hypothetical protein
MPLKLAASQARALAARAGVSVPDPTPRKTRIPTPEHARGLDTQCRALGLPVGVPEFAFHETRKWRADRAWLDARVLVEIDGGAFKHGRHTRGQGFENDCVKYAEAMVRGYRVLRVTTKMVKDGRAVHYLARLLGFTLTRGKAQRA